MRNRKMLHLFLPKKKKKRVFSDETYESKIKTNIWYKNPRKWVCCLEVGFALCLAVGGVIVFLQVAYVSHNLEERLFRIILAVQTDVMWKYLGEVQCSAALGYWQGCFALKLQTGYTSYYLKKGNCQVTMVMFPTVLFYGRVC